MRKQIKKVAPKVSGISKLIKDQIATKKIVTLNDRLAFVLWLNELHGARISTD